MTRGFVTFVLFALLMVVGGIWRYVAGDVQSSNMFVFLALCATCVAIAFELVSLHACAMKRFARIPTTRR